MIAENGRKFNAKISPLGSRPLIQLINFKMATNTKIIATIGPACDNKETLQKWLMLELEPFESICLTVIQAQEKTV